MFLIEYTHVKKKKKKKKETVVVSNVSDRILLTCVCSLNTTMESRVGNIDIGMSPCSTLTFPYQGDVIGVRRVES